MSDTRGRIETIPAGNRLELRLSGRWEVGCAAELESALAQLRPPGDQPVLIDLSGLDRLDTTGAWLIHRSIEGLRSPQRSVTLTGARAEHEQLIARVSGLYQPCEIQPPPGNALVRLVTRLGENALTILDIAASFTAFIGLTTISLLRSLLKPRRLRFNAITVHMEAAGINALPIVSLISFLIGIVMVYQGAFQLARFGAQIFVIDLLAFSVLRELGVLLTSIVVAGRSGSAFAAEIGSMKLHEEVDAMRALGMDPVEILVLPRVISLMVVLPLLVFTADIMALLGGAMMCWISLDIAPDLFLQRLRSTVDLPTFWIGVVKAPFFAALIALTGCYEGLQVSGSAESVGRHTTRAVVESIFLVIVADALFSILITILGL